MRQLFTIFHRRIAKLIRENKILYKLKFEECLLLSQNEERQRIKKWYFEQNINIISTLLCHLNSKMCLQFSKINQWYIKRVFWWLCDHIFK